MKRIFLAVLLAGALASCQSNQKNETSQAETSAVANNAADNGSAVPDKDAPVITWERETFDFGTIKQGEKVQHDFKFKNTGKTPLIISNASASCGCTVPEPPKEPIKPGAEGVIKVVFDSNGKEGMQDKGITITSNANPTMSVIRLVGEIKAN
ncbi:DUF1573 domain-containing protein [Pedobacter yulinensis]|uniref:DUF1573 domain-containing protein n=1 Tax=Pedobacter yulinensis TaxID=2126353 RepID=A0A2T3HHT8_9SPHI|nr:DUF1573 domain-containing protein [Pedobacter yulinensis]PST81941.1 DUF1573 domain-containing protein [Pedobacter yulinensis]